MPWAVLLRVWPSAGSRGPISLEAALDDSGIRWGRYLFFWKKKKEKEKEG
jgi:hypothetical protein